MRLLPAGTFQMGESNTGVFEPVHQVTVPQFWMDTTEVTQTDYLALMGVNPAKFTSDPSSPVEQVTWFDAVVYCNERSKRDARDTVYSYTGTVYSYYGMVEPLIHVCTDLPNLEQMSNVVYGG